MFTFLKFFYSHLAIAAPPFRLFGPSGPLWFESVVVR